MVAHTFNPSTPEAETGRSLSSRSAWSEASSRTPIEKPCLEPPPPPKKRKRSSSPMTELYMS
ncbi:hypothetical protein ACRRTK_014639 [Alexandromys fortis]